MSPEQDDADALILESVYPKRSHDAICSAFEAWLGVAAASLGLAGLQMKAQGPSRGYLKRSHLLQTVRSTRPTQESYGHKVNRLPGKDAREKDAGTHLLSTASCDCVSVA